ncbi:MAG: geranylgeranylglyceryl/heptaprenylglyceryl phosphate synthase [Candidatus Nanohalarchaeota archaeon]|nr:MAG: geranylgeranylglyceryl/heptaprenylglyceryl phosphate synthase [Candidatus Nanohaloarchaeota archaeon]
MAKINKIEEHIRRGLRKGKPLHFTLLDPETLNTREEIEKCINYGTDAFMLGGSLRINDEYAKNIVKAIKSVKQSMPVISFPGNVNGVFNYADAVFFMSLLNSTNPYWITGAQAISAFDIKAKKIEAISLAYIIIEPGETVAFIGDAKPIPRKKEEIACAYALSAQYMGFKFVYFEAGSGAEESVPSKMISMAKKTINIPLIVGGGIRTPQAAREKALAGADIIVTGNIVEDNIGILEDIIKAIKEI